MDTGQGGVNVMPMPGATRAPRFFHMPRFQGPPQLQSRVHYKLNTFNSMQNQMITFDGKRMRRAVYRKTVDYNTSVINYLEKRVWQRDYRDLRALEPDSLYAREMLPPPGLMHTPMNCVATKFIRTSSNKIRCPLFCVCWTPEGRRLITGASSGEFTLWNGLTFNFETILQAHDTSVRSMIWSHSDNWMLTADHGGFIKYWQSNMNNVKMYQAHKEPIRGLRWDWHKDVSLLSEAKSLDPWPFNYFTFAEIHQKHHLTMVFYWVCIVTYAVHITVCLICTSLHLHV